MEPNVFVLCTGRCGSTTFAAACSHITNYTSGHETRNHRVGSDRLAFPERHIEVDNRLSWFLGRMDKKYGKDAFYVHLTRDSERVAESFERRQNIGIMKGYRQAVVATKDTPLREVAHDLIVTVNTNIELFLKDKPNRMNFRLENWKEDFPKFWQWIGAVGDVDAALNEFNTRHNSSEESKAPLVWTNQPPRSVLSR